MDRRSKAPALPCRGGWSPRRLEEEWVYRRDRGERGGEERGTWHWVKNQGQRPRLEGSKRNGFTAEIAESAEGSGEWFGCDAMSIADPDLDRTRRSHTLACHGEVRTPQARAAKRATLVRLNL